MTPTAKSGVRALMAAKDTRRGAFRQSEIRMTKSSGRESRRVAHAVKVKIVSFQAGLCFTDHPIGSGLLSFTPNH